MLALALGSNLVSAAPRTNEAATTTAKALFEQSGFQGGFIVHVGCGDGRLTRALQGGEDHIVVQGLDRNAAPIGEIRETPFSTNRTFETFDGRRLPYVDNTVNLLVLSRRFDLSDDEMLRVLRPEGVACLRGDQGWTTLRKPRPEGMAEWTHLSPDSTGNIVGRDTLVGPPRRLQWKGGRLYGRSHEHISSFYGAVTSGGRLFSIEDHAELDHTMLPPRYMLVARDAFNGIVLWKKPLKTWHSHLFGRSNGPYQLQRRMVAAGDNIYMTLGLYEPLSVLDAASGEVIATFEETRSLEGAATATSIVSKPGAASWRGNSSPPRAI